ncbi:hypothetical protein [Nonomuraea angiospora]
MPLPQIPLDDPRVVALAKSRQQLTHDCTYLPTWDELTDEEREGSLPRRPQLPGSRRSTPGSSRPWN